MSLVVSTQHCLCCACYTGESSVEVKTEADSNDITEHPHDGKTRPYLCTVCDKRFTQKRSLNDHKRIHSGEKPFVCTVCDKQFSRKGSLKRHKRMHSGEKPFVCTVCDKRFTEKGSLKTHKQLHSEGQLYSCTQCEKRF